MAFSLVSATLGCVVLWMCCVGPETRVKLFILVLLISNGRKQLLVFINFVDMTGI